MMLERIAHAKINLALHVTGRRLDGYHLLDSLVVFTELGDRISVDKADNGSSLVTVSIEGPFGRGLEAGANNLVNRAALALGYAVTDKSGKPRPVTIRLEKNLPVASGIGGGSADAAATLLALREFWKADVELEPIAKKLGADVLMCLYSTPLRAQGIGDQITLLDGGMSLPMVLINPNVEISTPEIFGKLDKRDNASIAHGHMTSLPDISAISRMRNDLQEPAMLLCPEITSVLSALEQTSPLFFRMSGSGATCFALYENKVKANVVAERIRMAHPQWWCIATQTTTQVQT